MKKYILSFLLKYKFIEIYGYLIEQSLVGSDNWKWNNFEKFHYNYENVLTHYNELIGHDPVYYKYRIVTLYKTTLL